MNVAAFYDAFYDQIGERLRDTPPDVLDTVCRRFLGARSQGRKVIVAGNGASAAIASHVSVDLTKTLSIRSVSFNEPDLITCYANDYGYEHWIAKAIESYGDPGDVAVLISSSGTSPNVVNAARRARALDLTVITLSGFDPGNPLRTLGHENLWADSRSYNTVETVHQTWLLACVERIASTGGAL